MQLHLLLATLSTNSGGLLAQEITHNFLACGQKTYITGTNGQPN